MPHGCLQSLWADSCLDGEGSVGASQIVGLNSIKANSYCSLIEVCLSPTLIVDRFTFSTGGKKRVR